MRVGPYGGKRLRGVASLVLALAIALIAAGCADSPVTDSTTTTALDSLSTTTELRSTTTTTGEDSGESQVDVEISVEDDVNQILGSHPEGTTFLLKAGTYRRLTLVPKSGQTIIGEDGTVLDGESATSHAIGEETNANDVTLRNLKIVNYTVYGVAWGAQGAGKNWVIEDSEIADNYAGVELKDGGVVRNNHIHHNTTHGVWGNGTLILEGNEISFNHSEFHPGRAGGGVLLGRQTGSVIRNNHIHDNFSFGLHIDGHNEDILIEDNLVENNAEAGIFYELGFEAMIRDNVSRGNGTSADAGDGAGILIIGATDVTVQGNLVEGNVNGIAARQPDRTQSDGSLWELKNLLVVDNTVQMSQGWTGIHDRTSGTPSLDANNVFEGNTYIDVGRNFRWGYSLFAMTLSQWQEIHPGDG